MANLFPLFFEVDASGFAHSSPMDATSTLEVGKVQADGVGGVAFDAGSALIQNVADPSANTDAANKQWTLGQIQAALTGLSWKTAVKASTTGVLPAYTYANGSLGVGATLTASGNGAWSSVNSDGISLTAGTVSTGDRLLVKNETLTNQPYNGIYALTQQGDASHPWVLTRTLDDDTVAEMLEATVAVDQGAVNQDQTFIQTQHPTTMGSDNITWVSGPSINPYTASHGVKLVGSDFQANVGDGITLDGGAEPQHFQIALAGSNPGLQLTGTSPSKVLSAKVDATRAINVDASGLFLGLNGTNPGLAFTGTYVDTKLDSTGGLTANSNGLAVKTNGNTLTETGTSGLSVAYAPDYQTTRTAGAAITKGQAVYYNGNATVAPGDSSDLSKVGIVGVAKTNISNGSPGQIAQDGDIITGVLSSATAGTPYYLGHSGSPVLATALVSHDRAIMVGVAVNASDMEVRIHDIGKK